MTTRRERRAKLNTVEKIDFIHDDLDNGAKQFAAMRRETRLLLIGIIVAVIGTGMWSNL